MRAAMRWSLGAVLVALSACANAPVHVVVVPACRFEATLDGVTDVDGVGQRDVPGPDAQGDILVRVRPCSTGLLRNVELRNEGGTYSLWHSTADSGAWLLGVADPSSPTQLLNAPEGALGVIVETGREILLYGADNGSVRAGSTRYSVTLTYDDGHIEHALVRRADPLMLR